MRNYMGISSLWNRRNFLQKLGSVVIAGILLPSKWLSAAYLPSTGKQTKPATNIKDTLKYPRNKNSMPGQFPGRVVEVVHAACTSEGKPIQKALDEMLKKAMLELTGTKSINDAWRFFVSPGDRIGLKVNPVAGKLLFTSLEIVNAISQQLMEAGIPKSQILIWDRREEDLNEVGFKSSEFNNIPVRGTEIKDRAGSFFDKDGRLYSETMIDKKWFYWADVESKYDAETLPYMVNDGKYSYFSKLVTEEMDKIINIPVLKNAGSSVTLAMKNLAFGTITNTGRLHKDLWAETCAEVCAFPPLRDKLVLNIIDGIKGCYQGGPAANPQFITEFKTILVASDPVAIDRIGYEIILKKRIEEKIQKDENIAGRKFMELASALELGISDLKNIDYRRITLV
jgi:Domain of unknown function (DUF362)